jgi:hypothetical protein
MCVPAPAVNPLTTDFQEVKVWGISELGEPRWLSYTHLIDTFHLTCNGWITLWFD